MKRRNFIRGVVAAAIVPVVPEAVKPLTVWVGPSGPTLDAPHLVVEIAYGERPSAGFNEFIEVLMADVQAGCGIHYAVWEDLEARRKGGEV